VTGKQKLLLLLPALLAILPGGAAWAHDVQPGVLVVRELSAQNYSVQWFAPVWGSERPLGLEPRFPEHCRHQGPLLACGAQGLNGSIAIKGIERSRAEVVVQIGWANGQTLTETLNARRPGLAVRGVPKDAGFRATTRLAQSYLALGFEHILTGIDHLLFVVGLVLLVGFRVRLIWTITAFTLAHSLTLAASMLDSMILPRAPVESAIALSILLLAVELARRGPSLTRRVPWVVAFAFGLLHGFGFAGALAEIGLPPEHRGLSLVTFNVGVELGQLLVIGVVWGLGRLTRAALPRFRRLEPIFVYAMGGLAAYWFIDRASVIVAMAP
jgi:hydrogenase/urease accessory protein HupE